MHDQILKFPEVKRVYGNISLDEAKQAQRQHWLDDIFAGTFTEAQLRHSIAMTEARPSRPEVASATSCA